MTEESTSKDTRQKMEAHNWKDTADDLDMLMMMISKCFVRFKVKDEWVLLRGNTKKFTFRTSYHWIFCTDHRMSKSSVISKVLAKLNNIHTAMKLDKGMVAQRQLSMSVTTEITREACAELTKASRIFFSLERKLSEKSLGAWVD